MARTLCCLLCIMLLSGCCAIRKPTQVSIVTDLTAITPGEWVDLFDGKTLDGWHPWTDEEFKTTGVVEVKEMAVQLHKGMPFTGVIRQGTMPREDYELELKAMRVAGDDIFCGIFFPVGPDYISAVLGGWGNMVAGLSNVDGLNASENASGIDMSFKKQCVYKVRLQVTRAKITVWVDDKQIIEQERETHRFSPYLGLEELAPLGLFSWETGSALSDIRFRRLPKSE